jgi:hypothetical protein
METPAKSAVKLVATAINKVIVSIFPGLLLECFCLAAQSCHRSRDTTRIWEHERQSVYNKRKEIIMNKLSPEHLKRVTYLTRSLDPVFQGEDFEIAALAAAISLLRQSITVENFSALQLLPALLSLWLSGNKGAAQSEVSDSQPVG